MLPNFNNYRLDLEKIKTLYILCPHPLQVPRVSHAYAEAGLVYKLGVIQNKITAFDNSVCRKIHDSNYSTDGFNQLLINKMLDSYGYECHLVMCLRICGLRNFICVVRRVFVSITLKQYICTSFFFAVITK